MEKLLVPQQVLKLLQEKAGLTNESSLQIILLVWLIYTVPLTFVVSRARRPGFLPKFLAFLGFAFWLNLGLGVECRVSGESSGSGVLDLGHIWLTPIHDYAIATPWFTSVACGVNTIFVMGFGIILGVTAFVHGKPQYMLPVLPAGALRMIIGSLTRLPMPRGFVPVAGDWPPPSNNCSGFVLNPSGHCMQITVGSLVLYRKGHMTLFWLVTTLNVLQCIWLVAHRGHYTVDIFTAILIAFVCEQKMFELGFLGDDEKKRKTK